MQKKLFIAFCLLCTATVLSSQDADTAAMRPSRIKNFIGTYPTPRTAALCGIIPGGGQAYNRKWWKIPVVYGAIGGVGYWAITTRQQYNALRDNYKLLVDGDVATNPAEAPYKNMSATQMKGYRDVFRTNSEKRFLWLGVAYLLSVTDAFVDAHLASFDVSDDLSFRLVPDIQSAATGIGPSFGIGIRVGFVSSRSKTIPACP
ncbi:MAG: DUF5683 domain-containing protein [Bacteroidota bacterium]|jgi:hypothetical protein